MKVLSLFDGISCARVALERAGIPIELYYASEIDKYAIQIAQKNYPDTLQIGSVVDFHPTPLICGNIDLMVGGSPCQDLSIAKKDRKGLLGERSVLFWEYVRILKEVKPKWFILENVASMPKEAKRLITETLGVEPTMINAALVSAQNRKRLFWTNIPNITQPEDRGILLKDILEDGEPERTKSKTIRTSGLGSGVDDKHNWQEIRLKSYAIPATYYKENVKSLNKRKKTGLMVRVGQIGKGGQGDRVYSPEGKSTAIAAQSGGTGANTGLYEVKEQIRKLTCVECERLQSLPDNYTEYGLNKDHDYGEDYKGKVYSKISNTQRYKCLGNAFNVEVIAHILRHIPR